MLKDLNAHLRENLKKARESGKHSAEEVGDIVHTAVKEALAKSRGGASELREIARTAVSTTIKDLEESGEATVERVAAATEAAIDAIRSKQGESLQGLEVELIELKSRLREREHELAEDVSAVIDGVRDSASDFSGELKEHVVTLATDAKLQSAELLGLTRSTVKQAVSSALQAGDDVEETVANITRKATREALHQGHLAAVKVQSVTKAVVSAAVEAAEEVGKDIAEVTRGAVAGAREGVAEVIESAEHFVVESAKSAAKRGEDLTVKLIAYTKSELEEIDQAFRSALQQVAQTSGDIAREVLEEAAELTSETAGFLARATQKAAHQSVKTLKALGKEASILGGKAVDASVEEIGHLAKRSFVIAKGALKGMAKGAREAMKEEA